MADATTIKPKLIPDDELLPRDNSGGLDFEPYTMEFGDSGKITGGPKPHLAAGEGKTGGREARGGRQKKGWAIEKSSSQD